MNHATEVLPEDDSFHARNEDPYWNESSWIPFVVPERNIEGLVYFFHRPNASRSAGGPAFSNGQGEDIYDCLYWDWDTTQTFPIGCDMNDFRLENSLEVSLVEPLKELKISYDREDCELDLTWRAIMEPQLMKPLKSDELNPGIVEWLGQDGVGDLRIGHYEHAGKMTGTVRLYDETFEIDSWSIRDRTWGPRAVKDFPRSCYLWGIASESDHFLAVGISDLPRSQDPFDGTTERLVAGWYVKDGIKAELVSGDRRVLARGDDGRPFGQVIEAVDSLGRELYVEGQNRTYLKWTGYDNCLIWWGLADWRFDGKEVVGESSDYWTFAQNRQLMRSRRAAGARA